VNRGTVLVALDVSTDPARLDRDLIHAFLAEESYWARGRPRAVTERAIEGSLCFGAYDAAGAQLGFARVVTDGATFGYLADVFVVPRGRAAGVGKALVAAVMAHPGVPPRVMLATDDAHGLYAGFGFAALADPAKWMEIRRPR
jgi:GNAT superfamily N-acetyltransferase